MNVIMKKSPRAPSTTLKEAIDRASKAYERERLHEAPTDVVAQNIGYKNANSGTALSAIASLRYFGLLTRTKNGFLAIPKEFESYLYAPTNEQKEELLLSFLLRPALYGELLHKYATGLPSDATLRYELIQRGFNPTAAENALTVFKESVTFASYFKKISKQGASTETVELDTPEEENYLQESMAEQIMSPTQQSTSNQKFEEIDGHDKIPVRLSNGRRAWLIIPEPFYSADRTRLKAQIDLILTEDENDF